MASRVNAIVGSGSANARGLEGKANEQQTANYRSHHRPVDRAGPRVDLSRQSAQRVVTHQQRILDHGASGNRGLSTLLSAGYAFGVSGSIVVPPPQGRQP